MQPDHANRNYLYTTDSSQGRFPYRSDLQERKPTEVFPGLAFTLAGPVDAHHDTARFSWNLGDELVIGFDVLALDANGQIAMVYGFLDMVPA